MGSLRCPVEFFLRYGLEKRAAASLLCPLLFFKRAKVPGSHIFFVQILLDTSIANLRYSSFAGSASLRDIVSFITSIS